MNPSESAPATLPPPPLFIRPDGWCEGAVHLASPNFDSRPAPATIDLLVIHNISLPPGQFGGGEIAGLFTNTLDHDAHPYFEQLRPLRVSSHFLIERTGRIVQFVPAGERAWHAGVSRFGERERCNDFSIGIELEGTDFEAFTAIQYHKLAMLTVALERAYPLSAVTGHEHIAPGRKTDPGPFFDWHAYQAMYEASRLSEAKILPNATGQFPSGTCGDGKPSAGSGLKFCI